jgi:hypothetical protein
MAMKVARRPTTTPSASIWIHFLSTSDGFKAAVVLFSIFEVPGIDETVGPFLRMRERTEGALIEEGITGVNAH